MAQGVHETVSRMGAWPKTCGCCGRGYSAEQWPSLRLCGHLDQDPPHGTLEIRLCDGCGSSMAIELEPPSSEPRVDHDG
jgi:hypothetical protein